MCRVMPRSLQSLVHPVKESCCPPCRCSLHRRREDFAVPVHPSLFDRISGSRYEAAARKRQLECDAAGRSQRVDAPLALTGVQVFSPALLCVGGDWNMGEHAPYSPYRRIRPSSHERFDSLGQPAASAIIRTTACRIEPQGAARASSNSRVTCTHEDLSERTLTAPCRTSYQMPISPL